MLKCNYGKSMLKFYTMAIFLYIHETTKIISSNLTFRISGWIIYWCSSFIKIFTCRFYTSCFCCNIIHISAYVWIEYRQHYALGIHSPNNFIDSLKSIDVSCGNPINRYIFIFIPWSLHTSRKVISSLFVFRSSHFLPNFFRTWLYSSI